MKAIHQEAEVKMKQAIEHMHAELKRLRTGRATLGLLDGVTVDYFGTPTPLKQVATLTVVDATMRLIMSGKKTAQELQAIYAECGVTTGVAGLPQMPEKAAEIMAKLEAL